jgi:chemotaxis family two-component system response regulator Rcp1
MSNCISTNPLPMTLKGTGSGMQCPSSNLANEKVVDILMVEDDPGDARLTIEALKRSKVHTHLTVVGDGIEALDFLHCEGEYSDAARPDIILLDLNMPRMNGRELLTRIKQDPELQSIPVVVLTTSSEEEDIERSYFSHANCFITKPVDLKQFMSVVQSIDEFWFTVVKLPHTR